MPSTMIVSLDSAKTFPLREAPRKSPGRLVSIPDGNFQKTAVRPGAIRTGIGPPERNSQFLSLDRSLQLDVRPNHKRTGIDVWARGKVVKILQ